MATLKRNLIFNYFGSFLIAIFQFITIPFYIKLLGKDAYGLVGFYSTLQAVFIIFDLGISATFNREMAKASSQEGTAQYANNLFKTFEILYWLIALVVGLLVIAFSSIIANYWIGDKVLPKDVKLQSVIMMGVLLLFRWPIALYTGGLFGLQQQVSYNIINLIAEFVKAFGAILLLYFYNADIRIFFVWQVIISAFVMFVLRLVLKRKMPQTTEKPVFNFGLIASLRKFTLGMSGISLISILVYEADKLSVAKLTTLALLGVYTTTSSVASSLSRFSSPLGQSFYPRMVQEVQKSNSNELAKLFNKASQLMAVLVTPVSFLIFFFSKELLLIWTKNVEFSAIGADLLKIFIIGNLAVTFNGIPYILQLSYGYTKLTFYQNVFLLIVLIPALLIVVPKYGVKGAALLWMFSNVLVFCTSSFIMFKKYLSADRNYWYVHFIIKPVLISILCLSAFRYLFDYIQIEGIITRLGYFIIALLLSFVVLLLSYSNYRNATMKFISNLGSKIQIK